MRNKLNRFLMVLMLGFGWVIPVDAKEGPQTKAPQNFNKGSVGSCTVGNASEYLDVNNVRARLFNTGGLFFKDTDEYFVPKASGRKPLYASGIWVGGVVNGEVRVAGTQYRNWEFWPGPLDASGNAPADCSIYDEIYKVSKSDIRAYEAGEGATNDLENWPAALGAPVRNGDGVVGNYNLAGGDRPQFPGEDENGEGGADQMLWWVMNDVGNQHIASVTPPIGIEIRVTAFALSRSGPVGNMTFYKYSITYKGTQPLTDTYMSIFSDPDLGDAGDDYIGADTTLGLGFVWNGDNADGSGAAPSYGTPPPALGYDFFQGPITDKDGDGDLDTLKMTSFVYFNNGTCNACDPTNGTERYNYMKAKTRNGTSFTFGGNGTATTGTPTNFVYPGAITSPGTYWAENATAAAGGANTPDDRRFVMTTGPFTMQPNETQSIIYGVVFAKGANNIDSVAKLKLADRIAQRLFDVNFATAPPISTPTLTVTTVDGDANLTWINKPSDNNYLESYDFVDPAVPPGLSTRLKFEGYILRQYDNAGQSSDEAKILKVFDVDNAVVSVYDEGEDPETIVQTFAGTNSGITNNFTVTGLTNYKSHYFTIQACAYNIDSIPKMLCSAESPTVEFIPTRMSGTGTRAGAAVSDEVPVSYLGTKDPAPGKIKVTVADPTKVTGDMYEVRLRNMTYGTSTVLTFDIVNTSKTPNVIVFDGTAAVNKLGGESPIKAATTGDTGVIIDGLAFTIAGNYGTYGITDLFAHPEDHGLRGNLGATYRPLHREIFATKDRRTYNTETAALTAPGSWPGNGTIIRFYGSNGGTTGQIDEAVDSQFLTVDKNGDGTLTAADKIPPITEYKAAGGADPCASAASDPGCKTGTNKTWKEKLLWGLADQAGKYGMHDRAAWASTHSGSQLKSFKRTYEIRFTEKGSIGSFAEGLSGYAGENESTPLPFEVWDIGKVGPGEANTNTTDDVQLITVWFTGFAQGQGTTGFVDGIAQLPATHPGLPSFWFSDRMYAYYPTDYESSNNTIDIDNNGTLDTSPDDYAYWASEVALMGAGDSYKVNTASVKPKAITTEDQLAAIGIVPNPYRGASDYETASQTDEVRFTNLPKECTIRIFTVSGTLVKTLIKNDSNNYLKYDLSNDSDLRIASGMYIVHVEAPGVGEKVLKLGVVRKRVQLNTF